MATATTRLTFGAVLGSVEAAAATVTSTLDTATKAVGMLNRFVSDAADKQNLRSKVDMHEFKTVLVEQKAMEEALRKKGIEEFCKDSTNSKHYQAAYDRLAAIVNGDE